MSRRLKAAFLAGWVAIGGIASAQDEAPRIFGRVLGAGGAPVGGARVQGPGGRTQSDADGRFSLPDKPESEDQMLVVKADGYALGHVGIPPDPGTTEIVARLRPPKVALVRVVGEDGKPIRGATVRARLPFAPAYSTLERIDFIAVTDADGFGVVKDIPGDLAVLVEVRLPGMIPAQIVPLAPIRPPAAEDVAASAATLVVTPGRSLQVAVESESGRPVAGAAVDLLPLVEPRLDFGGATSRSASRGPIRMATTDASGTAAFDFLPAQPVTCEVRAAGMLTQLLVVEAAKGPSKPVRVRLRPDHDPPGRDIPWRLTIASAVDESKRLGLPVFLVMTMDGEKANDWMASHHYHDPEIVRAARAVVPILSSAFGKGGVGETDHVEKDGVCARYGTIPCRNHQEIERAAREALMQTRMVFEVPRHIAMAPSGERLFERVFFLSQRDLLRLIVRALRLTAPEAAVRLARDRLAGIVEDLSGVDGVLRRRGAHALALLANSGDEHAAALVQQLPALGLGAVARAEVAEGLRPCALSDPLATLLGAIRDPDRDVRRSLFGRCAEVADDDGLLDALAAQLGSNDGPGRETLLRALDVERKADELFVRAPADLLRWRIVEELIDLPEAGRVIGLEEILNDVVAPARLRLLRALGRRAAADPASQGLLVRASRGPAAVAALRAMSSAAETLKHPNPLSLAILEAARSADALAREEALRILAASSIPVDAEVLAASLSHPSGPVRIHAALALRRCGDRRGDAVLLAATRDFELGSQVREALRK